MLITTTNTVEGKSVEYFGVVTAEVIIGANFVRDIFAGMRDFFGGRSSSYEEVLVEAKQTALKELEQKAAQFGANAIIAVDFDYETIGARGSMLMVAASGTAVKLS